MFKRLLVLAFLGALAQSTLSRELPDFAQLVEERGAAVVNISTTQAIRDDPAFPSVDNNGPFFEYFRRFGPAGERRDQARRALGSGFIISHDGYILTNAHVIEGADTVTVRLTDKREFKAKVVGADKQVDVALLKIKAGDLPTIRPGDPRKLKVGEWVVAIGSPYGFDNSVTAGIVSAKGRSLPSENEVPFIQTDVAINPGNSGGPLFNMDGEVVGINSQILTRSGGYVGLSFAIPINVAMDVAGQLRATGKVTRGRIGVGTEAGTRARPRAPKVGVVVDRAGLTLSELSPGQREALRLDGGLVIEETHGPALRIGLRAGDMILSINNTNALTLDKFTSELNKVPRGRDVALLVRRGGRERYVALRLDEK